MAKKPTETHAAEPTHKLDKVHHGTGVATFEPVNPKGEIGRVQAVINSHAERCEMLSGKLVVIEIR